MKKKVDTTMGIPLIVILVFSAVPSISDVKGNSEDFNQWIPFSLFKQQGVRRGNT